MLDAPFFHLLLLIIAANAGPIIIKNILKNTWDLPIDGGVKFIDGQPLLGLAKTWRGLVASLIITPVVAMILGYSIQIGALISVLAMTGDLCSSFIKRRLKLSSSSMAPLLDQIPESLLPAAIMMQVFKLSPSSVFILIIIFILFELSISQVLYKMSIRKKPY